jgi:thiamine pyrophosphokinase
VVVLAHGEFPTHYIATDILRDAKTIVCCDGAVEELLLQSHRIPHFVVGDMDSIDDMLRRFYTANNQLHYEAEQDTNDLTKAIRFCVAKGFDGITILGASGKREDHMLGNISLLADYAKLRRVQLVTNRGVFHAIRTTTTFQSYLGQQISIFSLAPHAKITTRNLRYPIVHRALSSWWMGTLNEAQSETFTIEVERGRVLVYRVF